MEPKALAFSFSFLTNRGVNITDSVSKEYKLQSCMFGSATKQYLKIF